MTENIKYIWHLVSKVCRGESNDKNEIWKILKRKLKQCQWFHQYKQNNHLSPQIIEHNVYQAMAKIF